MKKQTEPGRNSRATTNTATLRAELEAQLSEESALNKLIADNLAKILTA